MSFIPHFGQWSGVSLVTSGCIGHTYSKASPSPTSGSPMSISAWKASVLSGGASTSGISRSRSTASSGAVRSSREGLSEWRRGLLVGDGDVGELVGPVRRPVLQDQLAGRLEAHVDDDALGRGEDDVLDELLVLDAAAVAADELHPRARQRDLEHPGVGRVRQVQPHDLARARAERELRARRR